jgi:nitrate reductase assembly molybdenum cofactor insertion protein NarJ
MSAEAIDLARPDAREAAARAAEFRLIGILFERPTAGRREEAEALAREARDPALREAAAALRDADEAAYVGLLGPGGPVSPREVAYRPMADPGWILADASAQYRAFGYAPDAEDPADHVAVETGFLAYLHLKEAYLLARGLDAAVAVEARERFLGEHLAPLAAGLAARLEPSGAPAMLALARLLHARTGAAPPAAAPDDGDEEFGCGGCGFPRGET